MRELGDYMNFNDYKKNKGHDHSCNCGTGKTVPHKVGTKGCVRYMAESPTKWDNIDGGHWLVEGTVISNFTLRQQRGYAQHKCGCWSRWPGSTNSLPDET